ncbi:unnamed protein product [Amoebophrya sp. A120]|nr:unnamed protein product [Amoebophrya sp. A120]|eukprot:GSA120T00009408001.1
MSCKCRVLPRKQACASGPSCCFLKQKVAKATPSTTRRTLKVIMSAAVDVGSCGAAIPAAQESFLRRLPPNMGTDGGVIITKDNFDELTKLVKEGKLESFEQLLGKTETALPSFDVRDFGLEVGFFKEGEDPDPSDDGEQDSADSSSAVERRTSQSDDVEEEAAAKRRKIAVSASTAMRPKNAIGDASEVNNTDVDMKDATTAAGTTTAEPCDVEKGCKSSLAAQAAPAHSPKFFPLRNSQFVFDCEFVQRVQKFVLEYEKGHGDMQKQLAAVAKQKTSGQNASSLLPCAQEGTVDFQEMSRLNERAYAGVDVLEAMDFTGEAYYHLTEAHKRRFAAVKAYGEVINRLNSYIGHATDSLRARLTRVHDLHVQEASQRFLPVLTVEVSMLGGDVIMCTEQSVPATSAKFIESARNVVPKGPLAHTWDKLEPKKLPLHEYNTSYPNRPDLKSKNRTTLDVDLQRVLRLDVEKKLAALYEKLLYGDPASVAVGSSCLTVKTGTSSAASGGTSSSSLSQPSGVTAAAAGRQRNFCDVLPVPEASQKRGSDPDLDLLWDVPYELIAIFVNNVVGDVTQFEEKTSLIGGDGLLDELQLLKEAGADNMSKVRDELEAAKKSRSERRLKDAAQRAGGFAVGSLLTTALMHLWLLDKEYVRRMTRIVTIPTPEEVAAQKKKKKEEEAAQAAARAKLQGQRAGRRRRGLLQRNALLTDSDDEIIDPDDIDIVAVVEAAAATDAEAVAVQQDEAAAAAEEPPTRADEAGTGENGTAEQANSAGEAVAADDGEAEEQAAEEQLEVAETSAQKSKINLTTKHVMVSDDEDLKSVKEMKTGDLFQVGCCAGALGWRCLPYGKEDRVLLLHLTDDCFAPGSLKVIGAPSVKISVECDAGLSLYKDQRSEEMKARKRRDEVSRQHPWRLYVCVRMLGSSDGVSGPGASSGGCVYDQCIVGYAILPTRNVTRVRADVERQDYRRNYDSEERYGFGYGESRWSPDGEISSLTPGRVGVPQFGFHSSVGMFIERKDFSVSGLNLMVSREKKLREAILTEALSNLSVIEDPQSITTTLRFAELLERREELAIKKIDWFRATFPVIFYKECESQWTLLRTLLQGCDYGLHILGLQTVVRQLGDSFVEGAPLTMTDDDVRNRFAGKATVTTQRPPLKGGTGSVAEGRAKGDGKKSAEKKPLAAFADTVSGLVRMNLWRSTQQAKAGQADAGPAFELPYTARKRILRKPSYLWRFGPWEPLSGVDPDLRQYDNFFQYAYCLEKAKLDDSKSEEEEFSGFSDQDSQNASTSQENRILQLQQPDSASSEKKRPYCKLHFSLAIADRENADYDYHFQENQFRKNEEYNDRYRNDFYY